ncbi:MAG: filamentous hemagglutinin N-terminal domain-containing protein [Planctomycetia bacterium]|nr:filamentous hemagglutinin N-terminal domain-containing protein [Planctomycetia bacterium]
MKKSMVLCAALALILGTMDASAKKLPVETKGGEGLPSLDVSSVKDTVGTTGVKLKKWYSFDVGKGQTFKFTMNTVGIVNVVDSKKRSTLQGTIESYFDDSKTIGGTVFLVNTNGITMRKGFTFKGDAFGATTAVIDFANVKSPEDVKGVPGISISLGSAADKTFTIDKGSLRLNKKGAISGNANFTLVEGAKFNASSPEGQNIRLGNITLGERATLDVTSGKNLNVRDIATGKDVGELYLAAAKNLNVRSILGEKKDENVDVKVELRAGERLRLRSASNVNADVYAKNVRLTKSNASDLGTVNFFGTSEKKSAPEKFSIAKGTKIAKLNYWDGTAEKSAEKITTPKRVTEKNFAEYITPTPAPQPI